MFSQLAKRSACSCQRISVLIMRITSKTKDQRSSAISFPESALLCQPAVADQKDRGLWERDCGLQKKQKHGSRRRDCFTGKNNRFPFLDILGYLKNTHKNPKFGRVRQVPIRELGWEFPGWDLSHFAKFGIFMGIL